MRKVKINLYSFWPFAQISDNFYYLNIWQCAIYFVAALFNELALNIIIEMWGLGLELPGLGLGLGFYDKISVSVSKFEPGLRVGGYGLDYITGRNTAVEIIN